MNLTGRQKDALYVIAHVRHGCYLPYFLEQMGQKRMGGLMTIKSLVDGGLVVRVPDRDQRVRYYLTDRGRIALGG